MRKPAFCICENKDADQLRCNREANQRLCFHYIDTPQPLYNTVHYNMVLDMTRISVGPQLVILDLFSYIHFTLVITRFG